jgi:hypothetical protein
LDFLLMSSQQEKENDKTSEVEEVEDEELEEGVE